MWWHTSALSSMDINYCNINHIISLKKYDEWQGLIYGFILYGTRVREMRRRCIGSMTESSLIYVLACGINLVVFDRYLYSSQLERKCFFIPLLQIRSFFFSFVFYDSSISRALTPEKFESSNLSPRSIELAVVSLKRLIDLFVSVI